MKQILTLITFCLLSVSLQAQSLSGNMNTVLEGEKVVMKYGNVDIYRKDKLIKTVLTDEYGNFNVALDTGTYICVLNYDGFAPVRKEIRVKGDEVEDFKVAESAVGGAKMKKERAKTLEWKAMGTVSTSEAHDTKAPPRPLGGDDGRVRELPIAEGMYDMKGKYADFINKNSSKAGPLTAGEVNDFSKWDLWKTYTEKEFVGVAKAWNLLPKGRYTVQLQNRDGLPIADAQVKLLRSGKPIYEARSDNTGKAELWASLKTDAADIAGKLSIEIAKNGKKEKIDRVTTFENGINHAVLKIDCDQSQVVDIAFVFDATGSMGDELRFLQNEIKQIIFDSKKVDDRLNFRFANVFYRDRGDAYVTKQMPFTRILTQANSYIDEQSAGGGGDTPEAVEEALDDAINNLEWSDDARTRLLFLLLDAPPHNTPEIREKMEKLTRLAAQKGIRIIPVGASGMGKDTEYLMRMIALGTNGTYTFLTNHSGVGGQHIEPTTDKYDVETLNALMVRLIKSYTFMPDCQSQIQDPHLPFPDSVVQYPFINTHQDSLKDSTIVDTARFDPNDKGDTLNITWSYYPNPTRGIVNIVVDRDIDALYITDITGKQLMVVKEIYKDRAVQVDLSPYPTGMYLIRYPVGKKWISGKVVLVRN